MEVSSTIDAIVCIYIYYLHKYTYLCKTQIDRKREKEGERKQKDKLYTFNELLYICDDEMNYVGD